MTRPNVLIIHTDQMRADAMGCTGEPSDPTAQLDALAQDACLLTRHIASNPICMPSRASLLTGLYPPAHGVWCNGVPLNRREYQPVGVTGSIDRQTINHQPPTLADLLLDADYRTGSFGKLHLTPSLAPEQYHFPEALHFVNSPAFADWHGPYFGFEHVVMTKGHDEVPDGHYKLWLKENHPDLLKAADRNRNQATRPISGHGDLHTSVLPEALHPTRWLAEQASQWIQQQDTNQPWFCFLGIPDPHHPFLPPAETVERFMDRPVKPIVDPDGAARPDMADCGGDVSQLSQQQQELFRRYTNAMVNLIDQAVGHLVQTLKSLDQWEKTVILFTSDHGDYLCDHGRIRKSRHAANQLLHIPCILRVPGGNLPARMDRVSSNTDILPTCCELAGVDMPAQCHGQSLLQTPVDPYAYAFAGENVPQHTNATIYDDRYRYTCYHTTGIRYLFDHRQDPDECHNLADDPAHRNRVDHLHRSLVDKHFTFSNPISGRIACW